MRVTLREAAERLFLYEERAIWEHKSPCRLDESQLLGHDERQLAGQIWSVICVAFEDWTSKKKTARTRPILLGMEEKPKREIADRTPCRLHGPYTCDRFTVPSTQQTGSGGDGETGKWSRAFETSPQGT